jgi:hypothetical protein
MLVAGILDKAIEYEPVTAFIAAQYIYHIVY